MQDNVNHYAFATRNTCKHINQIRSIQFSGFNNHLEHNHSDA
jgi:hypothetical protein